MTGSQASTRDIGELGQDHFKAWCTNNRLTAVASKPDRFGWDFLVEFESEADPSIPLDRQDDLIKVLVQVKSSELPSRSARGKLSALKRLVDTDLPAFVVHLDYEKGQPLPYRGRLLHIGATQIEQVLQKVRQTEKKGRKDIHNVRMSLPLEEAVDIRPDGSDLCKIIQAAIINSHATYAASKAHLRKSCGYDRNSIRANLTLADGLDDHDMVDLMLGYVPDLPIDHMTITRSRFGISLKNDVDRIQRARMSVDIKPHQRGRVTAICPNRNSRPSLEVDVFVPGIPGLSKQARRIRLRNDFLDLALNFGKSTCTVKFNIDPEARLSINQLADALAFGVAMSEAEAELELDIQPIGTLRIRLNNDFQSYAAWRTIRDFVDILALALFRHRRSITVEVCLREMFEALKSNHAMFATFSRPGLQLGAEMGKDFPTSLPKEQAIFMPVCIEFAELAYYAIVRAPAKATLEDNYSLRLIGGQPTVVEDGIVERSNLIIATLNDRAAKLAKTASGRDALIVSTTIDRDHN